MDIKTNLTNVIKNDTTRNKSALKYLYKRNPDLWDNVVALTTFLPTDAKPKQRVWHILNDIWNIPTCPETGKQVKWYENRYLTYSSFAASRKDVAKKVSKTITGNGHWRNKDKKKAQDADKKFTEGLKNGEHKVKEIKISHKDRAKKTKKTMLEKYGVENILAHPDSIKASFEKRIENGWITPLHLRTEKEQYYWWVDYYTNISWSKDFDKINPERLNRGEDWVVDHIYSKHWGFANNIPPYIIGHWTNLQMLSRKDNSAKGPRCDKTKEQLFEDFFA